MSTRPLEFDGIDHAVLQVTDIKRSLAFYVDVLGLSLERIIEDIGIYQLRCGRNLIDLCVLPSGACLAQRSQRGIDHLCLSIRGDMNKIVEYLTEHNGETISRVRHVDLYSRSGSIHDRAQGQLFSIPSQNHGGAGNGKHDPSAGKTIELS